MFLEQQIILSLLLLLSLLMLNIFVDFFKDSLQRIIATITGINYVLKCIKIEQIF